MNGARRTGAAGPGTFRTGAAGPGTFRSCCAFVPPWLLGRIARSGSPEQRDWALGTLAVDTSLRTARLIAATTPASTPPAPAVPLPATPRTVHDAGNTDRLPGRVVRRDDEAATGDAAVDEAWDGMGAADRYLREVHQRRSLDGDGAGLTATVHFGQNYANAFWDGTRIVCGDGDGEIFLRLTKSLDVIAHELGHGVVDDETGFEYQGQSGALNEHCADVIGTLVKQHAAGARVDGADWLIGADILGPAVTGRALRSMAAPGTAYDDDVLGKDPQPAHFDDLVVTAEDNGGVHINSGIPNHAFYLVATTLGGYAWERAGAIWYAALADAELRPDADFAAFAAATRAAALGRFGKNSPEARAVGGGWDRVGVTVG